MSCDCYFLRVIQWEYWHSLDHTSEPNLTWMWVIPCPHAGDPLRFQWNLFRMMICGSNEHMQNIKIILHAVFEIWSFEICWNSRKVTFWIFSDFRMPYFRLRTRQRAENWYSYLLFAKFIESAVRFNVSYLDFKLWWSKVGSRINDIFFGQFLGSPRINTRGYMGPILPEYDLWAQVYIHT